MRIVEESRVVITGDDSKEADPLLRDFSRSLESGCLDFQFVKRFGKEDRQRNGELIASCGKQLPLLDECIIRIDEVISPQSVQVAEGRLKCVIPAPFFFFQMGKTFCPVIDAVTVLHRFP